MEAVHNGGLSIYSTFKESTPVTNVGYLELMLHISKFVPSKGGGMGRDVLVLCVS